MAKSSARSLQNYIRDAKTANDLLPVTHTTDGFHLRSIAESESLEPQPCDIFAPDLLVYYFYGRPAFRCTADDATTLPAFLPVCFVLHPTAITSIKRIFPFDTGAFHLGLFARHLHKSMTCDDFALEPVLDSADKIVSKFFGTPNDYFLGTPVSGLNIPPFDFEAQTYYNLLKDEANTAFDDRKGCIEIQSEHSLDLNADTVLAVVLPSIFMDEESLTKIIVGEWKAEPLTYEVYHMRIQEYTANIYDLVKRFLEI